MNETIVATIIDVNGESCLVIPKEIEIDLGWKVGTQVVFEVIDSTTVKIRKWTPEINRLME
jgi:bifunctional DNA-binding transcriptional regulator/antitoxin component of YhaV-PrlF toxin-antitoxin module